MYYVGDGHRYIVRDGKWDVGLKNVGLMSHTKFVSSTCTQSAEFLEPWLLAATAKLKGPL